MTSVLLGCLCTAEQNPEYRLLVRDYADALLQNARDDYGTQYSPLIASTLNRKTLKRPHGQESKRLLAMPRKTWGIRPSDRILTGANPMHDQNLYQLLYALSEVTKQERYAAEADATLKWFFEHCQSQATGLMAWGEHIGWDFNTETTVDKVQRYNHEFFRPWVLWDRSFSLAEDACVAFARGLWDHQIHDQDTGEFSRHGQYNVHGTGTQNQYPRHAGFYIATWTKAYAVTREPVFLEAIETLHSFYHRHRNPQSGAIPGEVNNARSNNLLLWPHSNLSLAIDLWDAAPRLPGALAGKLRQMALEIDRVYLRVPHDLTPNGKGFVELGNAATLEAEDVRGGSRRPYTDRWTTGYGERTDASAANVCMLRYRQIQNPAYRKLIVAAADRYFDTEPDTDFPIYPGTMGDILHLMMNAHELTRNSGYLARADFFASLSKDIFFDESSVLPKASSKHDHYEAITRSDNLMMELLRLWMVKNNIRIKTRLVYTER
jgi:hypothetical protein